MAKVEYILDRDIFDESIREIAKGKLVIDVGAKEPFHKNLSKYKYLFKNTAYYALDIHYHSELDVIGDVQALPFKKGCADGIICYSVIELVLEPQKAVKEIYRILKTGGIAFVYVPFFYPYCGNDKDRIDCYRFSKDAIVYMFGDFNQIILQPEQGYINVALNFITGFKLKKFFSSKFAQNLESFLENVIYLIRGKRVNRLHSTTGYNIMLRK